MKESAKGGGKEKESTKASGKKETAGKKSSSTKEEGPTVSKRKPGAKGSKNKPKPGQKVWVVRKPGRPKRSKDKQPRKRRGSKGDGSTS